MRELEEIRILDFCTFRPRGTHSMQVLVRDADGIIKDIGEFIVGHWDSPPGRGLADGVLEWVQERPAAGYVLKALRATGEYCGPDEVYELLSELEVRGAHPAPEMKIYDGRDNRVQDPQDYIND